MSFHYSGDFEEQEFAIIPPNTKGTAILTAAVEKPDDVKTRVNVTVQFIEGEYKNRTFFHGYNTRSKAGKDYSVDERNLGRLCVILLGRPSYSNVSELMNKPFIATTGTKPGFGDTADKIYNCLKATDPCKGTWEDIKNKVRTNTPTPPIAHSTITNGAGGVFNPAADEDSEVPFY